MTTLTLGEALHMWLAAQKPRTRQSYEYVVRDFLAFAGERRPLSMTTPSLLLEYKTLIESRNWADATYNKSVKTLRTGFNWLRKNGFIAESPARVLPMRRIQRGIDRSKAITDAELARILEYTRWKPRDHALVLFLADTGCRAGGAANLTWDDLDLLQMQALVTEKGAKKRVVWFGEACAEAIRTWHAKRPRGAGAYVFSRSARPLQPASVSQVLERACEAVGIRRRGAHSLRHRKGYQLADARIAPSVAATALGHEHVLTTLQHYYPDDAERAKRAIRELATNPQPAQPQPEQPPSRIIRLPKRG